MWRIQEHRRLEKVFSGRVPIEVLKRYEKWKDIVRISGPSGLLVIKGFRDEALAGEREGYRSSRLDLQWRVIYRIEGELFLVEVVQVTPHDYGRP